MSKYHSSIARDDSELTAYLEIPPGYHTYLLPVLSNLNLTLGEAKDLWDLGEIKTCELNRPQRYNECEHHEVFLIWR